jgi:hypothetical protein
MLSLVSERQPPNRKARPVAHAQVLSRDSKTIVRKETFIFPDSRRRVTTTRDARGRFVAITHLLTVKDR